jgi:hypothetical protein
MASNSTKRRFLSTNIPTSSPYRSGTVLKLYKPDYLMTQKSKKPLDIIPSMEYNMNMWEVEYTEEFEEWWETLSEAEHKRIAYSVNLLRYAGPSLSFPHSTEVKSSRHGSMRELRSQCEGRPLRTFYAFDPRRTAILLIGGDKTGDDRFYEIMVPIADKIYDNYLKEIREENNG